MSDPRIVINPKFSYVFDERAVLLNAERAQHVITHPRVRALLRRIHEGVDTEDALVDDLYGEIFPAEVLFHLRELKRKRVLAEPCPEWPEEETVFWEEIEFSAHDLRAALAGRSVSVHAVDYTGSPDELIEACARTGVRVATEGDLALVLTDDYESPALAALNDRALAGGKSWMLVRPLGSIVLVGPIFVPGETGCWRCLAQRMALNRQTRAYARAPGGRMDRVAARASHPVMRGIALSLAALEAAKFLAGPGRSSLEGNVLSFGAAEPGFASHRLVRRPQCAACGDKDACVPAPLCLDKEDELLSLDGGFRTVEPEETFERYRHHVSGITGVVQFIEPSPREDRAPVFNYCSGANIAMQSPQLYWLNRHVRSYTGGKGKNHAQARAGALCEALERYSCTYTGDDEVVRASLAELGDAAIHPRRCMLFSEEQYRHREELNAACLKHYFLIPARFDEHEVMEWVRLDRIGGGDARYLPASYCLYNFTRANDTQRSCYADSNGCAAGNTLEEAVLQGLMELVERDAVAIWWYNRLLRPEVDLRSFRNPYFERLLRYHHTLGRTLYALDLTFDLGLPCFAAVSHEHGTRIMIGFGAHTDPNVAMERALVEVNQFFPTLNMKETLADRAIQDWLATATIDNQPYLAPAPDMKREVADYPPPTEPGIVPAVRDCLDRLRARNLDAYYLNLTRPDIGLPVARVVVPGLRHFWKRFAPGRLYTVPVDMGLLNAAKSEAELNPTSVFF